MQVAPFFGSPNGSHHTHTKIPPQVALCVTDELCQLVWGVETGRARGSCALPPSFMDKTKDSRQVIQHIFHVIH